MLTPYIDKINSIYDELVDLTDDELKKRFKKIKDDLKEQILIENKQLIDEGYGDEDISALFRLKQKNLS